jgi:hypothetical protein
VASGVADPGSSDGGGSAAKMMGWKQRKRVASTDGFASVRVWSTERFEDDVEEGVCVCSISSACFVAALRHVRCAHAPLIPAATLACSIRMGVLDPG